MKTDAFAAHMSQQSTLAARLAKLDALADPSRNPNEHEREVAARMAAELRKKKPYAGPARRWIITKDMKRCRDRRCIGWERFKCKVTVDGNEASSMCLECGGVETFELKNFTDSRPCTHCGWVRDVKVSFWAGREEMWRKECDACELDASAIAHAKQAKRFVDKAARIRFERERKKEKKTRAATSDASRPMPPPAAETKRWTWK